MAQSAEEKAPVPETGFPVAVGTGNRGGGETVGVVSDGRGRVGPGAGRPKTQTTWRSSFSFQSKFLRP